MSGKLYDCKDFFISYIFLNYQKFKQCIIVFIINGHGLLQKKSDMHTKIYWRYYC